MAGTLAIAACLVSGPATAQNGQPGTNGTPSARAYSTPYNHAESTVNSGNGQRGNLNTRSNGANNGNGINGSGVQPGTWFGPNNNNGSSNDISPTGQNGRMTLSKRDAGFLKTVYLGSMMEVQMGQIAQSNANSAQVKQLASMLIRDHQNIMQQDAQLANSVRLGLPSKLHGDQIQELSKLRGLHGSAFDQEFLRFNTREHQKDVKKLQAMSSKAQDPQVRLFVSQIQPTIQGHLDRIVSLDRQLGVNVNGISTSTGTGLSPGAPGSMPSNGSVNGGVNDATQGLNGRNGSQGTMNGTHGNMNGMANPTP
jgi:putative membrane protein